MTMHYSEKELKMMEAERRSKDEKEGAKVIPINRSGLSEKAMK